MKPINIPKPHRFLGILTNLSTYTVDRYFFFIKAKSLSLASAIVYNFNAEKGGNKKKKTKKTIWFGYTYIILIAALLSACNLSQQVDIDLPDPIKQTVVECYLEPGKPYRLLLTKNQSYFADFPTDAQSFFDSIVVNEATVSITRGNKEIILSNTLQVDLDFSKIYNYSSTEIVPFDTDSEFTLNITLEDGTKITGMTRILPIVPIDSIVVQEQNIEDAPSGDSPKARILLYFSDDQSQSNYYRRMFHWNSLDSIPEQDFVTIDDFFESKDVVFGSGYFYNDGDTIYNTLFHMSKEYYDYQHSIFLSIDASTNPFATPGIIESNVESDDNKAIGIFTGLSFVRDTTIIEL